MKNVADIAKRNGAHFVLVSSALVTPKNKYAFAAEAEAEANVASYISHLIADKASSD